MSEKRPWLIGSRRHADACHKRWLERREQERGGELRWQYEQCGRCQYYFPIQGALQEDWGACTNPDSPFDGRVMSEHDGCEAYSEAYNGLFS